MFADSVVYAVRLCYNYNTLLLPDLHKFNILPVVHKFFHHPDKLSTIFSFYYEKIGFSQI